MKRMYLRLLSVLPLAVLMIVAACNGGTGTGGGSRLTVEAFDQQLKATPDAQLIDVRTPEEYAQGHLRNARLMNVQDENERNQLDKNKAVFVYCLSGGRSQAAVAVLKQHGFTKVFDMPGVMAWAQAGKELVTEETTVAMPSNGITLAQYQQLMSEKGYIMADFSAPWCQPCKVLAPILAQLEKEYEGKLIVKTFNADEQGQLCKDKGIDGIPFLELYHNGKLIWTHQGLATAEEIKQQIN